MKQSPDPDILRLRNLHGGQKKNSLEDLLAGRVRVLTDLLADVTSTISSRRRVSQNFMEATDEHYCCVKSKLLELEVWPIATSQRLDQRRSALERELDTLTRDKRREMIACWQDTAELKREFRSWFREYADLQQRTRILLPDSNTPDPRDYSFPDSGINTPYN